jgi:LytR cell envelope-related transcriptional attenuator
LLVLVVVLALGGGGYEIYHHVSGGSSSVKTALPPCPATTSSPPLTQTVRVVVRNATLKSGLATQVAHALRRRDFTVAKVGNTLFRGKGVATIRYSADRTQVARQLGAQFAGATLVQVAGNAVLEVDIGPKFRALTPVAQAQAAEHSLATPTPTPSSSPCASAIS